MRHEGWGQFTSTKKIIANNQVVWLVRQKNCIVLESCVWMLRDMSFCVCIWYWYLPPSLCNRPPPCDYPRVGERGDILSSFFMFFLVPSLSKHWITVQEREAFCHQKLSRWEPGLVRGLVPTWDVLCQDFMSCLSFVVLSGLHLKPIVAIWAVRSHACLPF